MGGLLTVAAIHRHRTTVEIRRCSTEYRRRRTTMMAPRWAMTLILSGIAIAATHLSLAQPPTSGTASVAKAYFAGGCFWCMEEAFEKVDGVLEVVSGYMGGTVKNPSYEQVSAGQTGHAEAVEVRYDPAKVTYTQLLEAFWRNIDPVTPNAQFCDHGTEYRRAFFYKGEEQKGAAEESKRAIELSKRFSTPIVTQLTAAPEFYPAEDYHRDFYKKNPVRYNPYML